MTGVTGYVQPKADWISQVRDGCSVHHATDGEDTAPGTAGDTARLAVRTVTDATADGTRANRGLRPATACARDGGARRTLHTVATR
ncbi:hypothetical protein [Streptomyces sp. NPDC052701]|uniref:hypothetical protein n=1 Tax=Streptomyces sp. NPDC052701 TaxID=3155533 RepID=UPI0034208DB2